jgi:hypothetical protein
MNHSDFLLSGAALVLFGALTVGCEKEAPVQPAPEPATSAPAPAPDPVAEPEKTEPAASVAQAPSPSAEIANASVEKPAAAEPKKPPPSGEATPKPEARKVKTVRGSAASGDGFAVSIQAQSPVRTGEGSTATVVLSCKAPFKCNQKYPYKMALDAPSGVSYASQTVRGASVSEKSTTLGVPFTAASKGKATVGGTFSFSVCTDDKCLIEKRPLSVNIDVD